MGLMQWGVSPDGMLLALRFRAASCVGSYASIAESETAVTIITFVPDPLPPDCDDSRSPQVAAVGLAHPLAHRSLLQFYRDSRTYVMLPLLVSVRSPTNHQVVVAEPSALTTMASGGSAALPCEPTVRPDGPEAHHRVAQWRRRRPETLYREGRATKALVSPEPDSSRSHEQGLHRADTPGRSVAHQQQDLKYLNSERTPRATRAAKISRNAPQRACQRS